MSLGPLDTSVIVARILDTVDALRVVGGAADFVAAYERPGALPAAYVVLTAEDVTVTNMAGALMHSVVARVDVAIAVRSYAAAARGAEQIDDLRPLIAAIRVALNGWRPTIGGAEVIESMRGAGRARVLRHGADVVWWAEPFTVAYRGRV